MKSSLLSSPILSICLVVVFGYMAVSLAQTTIGSRNSMGGKSDLVQRIDELVQRKKALEEELAWVKTDAYVEQEARNQLHLTKANEIVVVYPEQAAVLAAASQSASLEEDVQAVKPGFVEEWLKVFKL